MRTMAQPGSVAVHEGVDGNRERQLELEHREAIERLAYHLWKDRGCPSDSAESIWLEAEKRLVERLVPSARD